MCFSTLRFHFAVILFIIIIFFIIIHVNRSLRCMFVVWDDWVKQLSVILFFITITKLSFFTFWWVKRCTQPAPQAKPTVVTSLAVLTALLGTFFNLSFANLWVIVVFIIFTFIFTFWYLTYNFYFLRCLQNRKLFLTNPFFFLISKN